MNYDFKTKEEFRDFIIDYLQSKRVITKIENLAKGINSISTSKKKWDWIEERELYVVTNKADTLYIIFPILRPPGDLWYIPLYEHSMYGERLRQKVNSPYHAGTVDLWQMSGPCWVKKYILLESDSSGFINWKKNPFENK